MQSINLSDDSRFAPLPINLITNTVFNYLFCLFEYSIVGSFHHFLNRCDSEQLAGENERISKELASVQRHFFR